MGLGCGQPPWFVYIWLFMSREALCDRDRKCTLWVEGNVVRVGVSCLVRFVGRFLVVEQLRTHVFWRQGDEVVVDFCLAV